MMALIFFVGMVSFLIWEGDFARLGIYLFFGYLGYRIIKNNENSVFENHYLKRNNNRNIQQQNAVNDSVAKQKPNEEQLEDLAEERAEEYAEDYYNYLHEDDENAPDFEYDGCVSRRDIPDMLNEIEERYEEEREKREDW